jgi:hypothetical protein
MMVSKDESGRPGELTSSLYAMTVLLILLVSTHVT